jgi:hypothetical protein
VRVVRRDRDVADERERAAAAARPAQRADELARARQERERRDRQRHEGQRAGPERQQLPVEHRRVDRVVRDEQRERGPGAERLAQRPVVAAGERGVVG